MTLTATLLGPAGGGSTTGSQSISGGTYNVQYSLKYVVLDSTLAAGPVDVLNASGLPAFENSFTGYGTLTDTMAFVSERSCELVSQGNEANIWHVNIKWEPLDLVYANPIPTSNQPMASWSAQKFEVPALVDQVTGYPITSSSLEYFDPPETRDLTRLILTIVKWQQFYDPVAAQSVGDSTNLYTWGGFSPKTVKLSSIVPDPPVWNPLIGRVWRVTYTFEVQPQGFNWQAQPVDQGYRTLVGSGPYSFKTITDENGIPVTSPQLLDGSGSVLTVDPVDATSAVFLTYDSLPPLSFSTLGIGLTDWGTGPQLL